MTESTGSTLLRTFEVISDALAFTPEDFDIFNQDIQRAIEKASPEDALALATIKLKANQRFYRAVRCG